MFRKEFYVINVTRYIKVKIIYLKMEHFDIVCGSNVTKQQICIDIGISFPNFAQVNRSSKVAQN